MLRQPDRAARERSRLRLARRRRGADQHRVDGAADRLPAAGQRRAAAGDRSRVRRAAGERGVSARPRCEAIWVVDDGRRRRDACAASPRRRRLQPWPASPAPAATAPIPCPPSRRSSPADILAILYTSGTTGPAKGVLCPQAQYHWWGVHSAEILGVGADDVLCTTLPLFHINALNTFAQASLAGARVAFEPRFSASAFWPTMRSRGATVVYLLGAMVPILLAQPVSAAERGASRPHRPRPRRAGERRGGVSRAHRRAAGRRLRLDRDQLRHRQRARPIAARLHGLAAAGLRCPRRRRARRRAAGGRGRRAAAARRRAVRLRERLLRQARGDRRRLAQPLVPHRRPGGARGRRRLPLRRPASRTRSAGAARTSRRTRSSRCCRAIPAVAAVAVYPVRSELAEDEVMAAVVARRGRGDRPGRARRASAARGCRTSRSRATSRSSPTCRAPRTARCRSSGCASAA